MPKYNPTNRKYAGIVNTRPATHKNKVARDKNKYDARGKRGRQLTEDLPFSNFEEKSKKPSIEEVPIHVCMGISNR